VTGLRWNAAVLAQLEAKFPEDLRIIYRHYPLNIHDKAQLSAQAAKQPASKISSGKCMTCSPKAQRVG